jgi:(p)ppGpp synthase/HD superfamily hydrolase
MNISNSMLEDIIIFAAKKHRGQSRKGNKLPYIIHPTRVAMILLELKESKNINLLLAVCFLHDTVEDCGVSLKTIAKKFGHAIASLVGELTLDKDKYETIGKTEYLCQEVLQMSSYALCIKLCDRLDNVRDMKSMTPEFRAKYSAETRKILENLSNRKLTKTHKKLVKLIQKIVN